LRLSLRPNQKLAAAAAGVPVAGAFLSSRLTLRVG